MLARSAPNLRSSLVNTAAPLCVALAYSSSPSVDKCAPERMIFRGVQGRGKLRLKRLEWRGKKRRQKAKGREELRRCFGLRTHLWWRPKSGQTQSGQEVKVHDSCGLLFRRTKTPDKFGGGSSHGLSRNFFSFYSRVLLSKIFSSTVICFRFS